MHRRCFLGLLAAPAPDTTLLLIQGLADRWAHTCRQHLLLPPGPFPWLVFFDREQAWHVNAEALPMPASRVGGVRWQGRRLKVERVANTARGIWLPDGETIQADAGAVTKPWARKGRKDSAAFVHIPVPSAFRAPGGGSISEKHWYSLGLHELTHTLQMLTVIRQWRALQAKFPLPQSVDDDMIETAFRGNADYEGLYTREKQLLQTAVFAEDLGEARRAVRESLALARQRQKQFFKPGWKEAEGLWLALEGCALWVQVRYELENAPAGESWQQTAMGMAGFMGSWAQEHGAGLFWMIDRLVPDWKPRYFGGAPVPSPFEVLEGVV